MDLIQKVSTEFQANVIEVLSKGYGSACSNYHRMLGSNESTFGTDVYNFVKHEWKELCKTSPDIALISEYPTFRLRHAGLQIACHRVGKTASEDIWNSFPNNDCAAARLVVQQTIPGLDDYVAPADKCIIAHFGNYVSGFAAAYLCVPSESSHTTGRVTAWRYAAQIAVITPATVNFAPEESTPDVVVTKKGIPANTVNKDELSAQRDLRNVSDVIGGAQADSV